MASNTTEVANESTSGALEDPATVPSSHAAFHRLASGVMNRSTCPSKLDVKKLDLILAFPSSASTVVANVIGERLLRTTHQT